MYKNILKAEIYKEFKRKSFIGTLVMAFLGAASLLFFIDSDTNTLLYNEDSVYLMIIAFMLIFASIVTLAIQPLIVATVIYGDDYKFNVMANIFSTGVDRKKIFWAKNTTIALYYIYNALVYILFYSIAIFLSDVDITHILAALSYSFTYAEITKYVISYLFSSLAQLLYIVSLTVMFVILIRNNAAIIAAFGLSMITSFALQIIFNNLFGFDYLTNLIFININTVIYFGLSAIAICIALYKFLSTDY